MYVQSRIQQASKVGPGQSPNLLGHEIGHFLLTTPSPVAEGEVAQHGARVHHNCQNLHMLLDLHNCHMFLDAHNVLVLCAYGCL